MVRMNAVDSDAFGCHFDTGSAVPRAWMLTETARGRLIKQVHLKDTRVAPGLPSGQGRRISARWRALRETGFDGWLVGEFTVPGDPHQPPPPPEVVARSVLRHCFPEPADRGVASPGCSVNGLWPWRIAKLARELQASWPIVGLAL
jgi:hypothetical protein